MNNDNKVSYEDVKSLIRDDYAYPDIQELLIEIILKTTDINNSGVKGRRDLAFKAVLGAPDSERKRSLKRLKKLDEHYFLRKSLKEAGQTLWERAKAMTGNNAISESPDEKHEKATKEYMTLKNHERDYAKNIKEYGRLLGQECDEPFERWINASSLISLWLSRWSR